MAVVLRAIGFFIWFAMLFTGGVGGPFVNASVFCSALFAIITGSLIARSKSSFVIRGFAIGAVVLYMPLVWQRFQVGDSFPWQGLIGDGIYLALLIGAAVNCGPNISLNPDGPDGPRG